MYFVDIYNKIRPLWKDDFSLDGIDKTETYVQDIRNNWNSVDRVIDFLHKEDYTDWERMLSFTMYGTLIDYALEKWNKTQETILNFNEIPIEVFEKYYLDNLKEEGNEEYLKKYQGLMPKD